MKRRKTWRASDPDHIPKGRRVILLCDPFKVCPSSKAYAEAMALVPRQPPRVGRVTKRYGSGEYMIQLEGSAWGFVLPRDVLLFPVPENVVPFSTTRGREAM